MKGDFNELINYEDYKNRAEKTKEIRELLLQQSIITNNPSIISDQYDDEDEELNKLLEELDDEDEDSEDIIVPWEEN